jgi:hypothetical protein
MNMFTLKQAAAALAAAGIVAAAAAVLAQQGPAVPAAGAAGSAPLAVAITPPTTAPGAEPRGDIRRTKAARACACQNATSDGSSSGRANRPGSDPRSQALLARLEEPIPMHFDRPTPLEDVLKYIRSATAGPDGAGIAIHVDPAGLDMVEKSLESPIIIEVAGVPLRRTLQLVADQLSMGYGIKDGMVTVIAPDFARQNWRDLLVVERGPFPELSPLQLAVEKAERGELSEDALMDLNEQLKAVEEVSQRYRSIRTPRMLQRFSPPKAANPQ